VKVAFVGLGAMGRRMARRLVDAGNELTVWNRTPERAEPLVAAGASLAASPADAARGAEVVFVMVADPPALADVADGESGIAAALAAGAALVQMSTVGIAATARLAAGLPAGAALLDAPVLGSLAEAESGALRIFAGGDADVFERLEPLLSVLGDPVHVGAVGAGSAAKLVANSTLFSVLAALGESIAVADRLGLDRRVTFDVLSRTPLGSQAERRRPSLESGDYPTRFALALALKDANLVAEASEGLDLRVLDAARSWLADALAAGFGDSDYSAVLEQIVRQH
jgi:3-hydroxyisobutyrate dehydrogenase-like beta-hydroxyacid dehydrogenase